MSDVRSILAVAVFATAFHGCSGAPDPCPVDSHLASSFALSAPGITVEIQRSPYRYVVKNAAGAEVLSTLGGGARDGYGAASFTSGQVFMDSIVSQGYYSFDATLDPWRDEWKIVSILRSTATELDVMLSPSSAAPDNKNCIVINHTLRSSTLRIEAHLEGEKAAPPRAWAAAFASPARESFLGFGERYNRVNQRGLDLYSWPEEGGLSKGEKQSVGPANPWPNGATMTYYPVPFFLSTEGYGFWLDTTWRNQFNLASTRSDAWRAWEIGPTLAYEVYVPLAGDPRPWPYHIIDLFTGATGRPMVPPGWSFGPRRRVNRGAMQSGVSETQAMRKLDLALTVVDDANHFLPDGGDIGHEAELSAWTADNRRLGYRTLCYYNAFLSTDKATPVWPDVQKGLANHWFLRDADGTPSSVWLISGHPVNVYTIDFTSQDATGWYTSMFQRALKLGYSGWMYDFGEYVQPNVVTSSGPKGVPMTGLELHNLFPVLYQKAAYDALETGATAGDWYTFVRSGYTGASQYSPMVWSGDPDASFSDAEGIPAQVRAGINIGISGVANWGSDIGGYKCLADGSVAADGEMLARWVELGSMSSNMHDEDACAGGNGPKATIWSSTDAQAAWKTYARLHTRMFPYLEALAKQAHQTGAPLVRHLYLEHPERLDLAAVDDAYYFGPSLLVAPVVHRGARSRSLALPAGHYLDWQAQSIVEGVGGGATVILDAPLGKLPLLLRDGQLLPLLDPTIDTLVEAADGTTIGPAEVAQAYDVVGLVSTAAGHASFTLADGGTLAAVWSGGFAPPALAAAKSEADLGTCAGCYLQQQLTPQLTRVRVSGTGAVTAGGLALTSTVKRRIRWDLYLVP